MRCSTCRRPLDERADEGYRTCVRCRKRKRVPEGKRKRRRTVFKDFVK